MKSQSRKPNSQQNLIQQIKGDAWFKKENFDLQISCCLSKKYRSREKIYKEFKTRYERRKEGGIYGKEREGNGVDKRNLQGNYHCCIVLYNQELIQQNNYMGWIWFKERKEKRRQTSFPFDNTSLPISSLFFCNKI